MFFKRLKDFANIIRSLSSDERERYLSIVEPDKVSIILDFYQHLLNTDELLCILTSENDELYVINISRFDAVKGSPNRFDRNWMKHGAVIIGNQTRITGYNNCINELLNREIAEKNEQ